MDPDVVDNAAEQKPFSATVFLLQLQKLQKKI